MQCYRMNLLHNSTSCNLGLVVGPILQKYQLMQDWYVYVKIQATSLCIHDLYAEEMPLG